jgi:hypothetical protein
LLVLAIFLGVFGCYLALSPGSVGSMGYLSLEMQCGDRMLTIVDAWRKGVTIPPMIWSQHGPLTLIFDIPFLVISKFSVSEDFWLSFQPVLLSAGAVTIIFLWLRQLALPAMSFALTLTAAFGTMLWPYAYIGLETKQSFFVLLAAYLALARSPVHGWLRTWLFAFSCGFAIALKSNAVVLIPAILWLVYAEFRKDWRVRRAEIAVVLLVMAALLAIGALGRLPFWRTYGGGVHNLRMWLIDSPISFFANCFGVFGSPNKGLFLYAPVLVMGIYAIPHAWRTHRDITIFALLITAGITGLVATIAAPGDECWGSRYMHSAIAPLMVCIGAAYPRLERNRAAALAALAAVGVFVSFLGAFYWYGTLHVTSIKAGNNTLEWLNGDPVWNPVRFNWRLFRVWLQGGSGPVLWNPGHHWMAAPAPASFPPVKLVELRELCRPYPFLVRFWGVTKSGPGLWIFRMYFVALLMGVVGLAMATLKTMQEGADERVRITGSQPASARMS